MAIVVQGVTKLTYDDYAAMDTDDLQRHEIMDGVHVVSPSPTVRHQRILMRLYRLLVGVVEDTGRGEVFIAPLDVELTQVDVVQPDLMVVLNLNADLIIPSRIKGAADLVAEILSPSNKAHDSARKRAAYERAGVREYWMVDPESQEVQVLQRTPKGLTASRVSREDAASAVLGSSNNVQSIW